MTNSQESEYISYINDMKAHNAKLKSVIQRQAALTRAQGYLSLQPSFYEKQAKELEEVLKDPQIILEWDKKTDKVSRSESVFTYMERKWGWKLWD